MSHGSVLRALSILTFEDILQLSSADEEIIAFQQVAGGEWVTAPAAVARPRPEAKILSFPASAQLRVKDLDCLPETGEEVELEVGGELSLDFILTQRTLWKEGVEKLGLTGAIDSYLQQLQMISIKEKNREGKDCIRFISTQGLLVNKKHS